MMPSLLYKSSNQYYVAYIKESQYLTEAMSSILTLILILTGYFFWKYYLKIAKNKDTKKVDFGLAKITNLESFHNFLKMHLSSNLNDNLKYSETQNTLNQDDLNIYNLLNYLLSQNIAPNDKTYSLLIQLGFKYGNMYQANQMFNELTDPISKICQITKTNIYTDYLEALLESKVINKYEELKAIEKQHYPKSNSFTNRKECIDKSLEQSFKKDCSTVIVKTKQIVDEVIKLNLDISRGFIEVISKIIFFTTDTQELIQSTKKSNKKLSDFSDKDSLIEIYKLIYSMNSDNEVSKNIINILTSLKDYEILNIILKEVFIIDYETRILNQRDIFKHLYNFKILNKSEILYYVILKNLSHILIDDVKTNLDLIKRKNYKERSQSNNSSPNSSSFFNISSKLNFSKSKESPIENTDFICLYNSNIYEIIEETFKYFSSKYQEDNSILSSDFDEMVFANIYSSFAFVKKLSKITESDNLNEINSTISTLFYKSSNIDEFFKLYNDFHFISSIQTHTKMSVNFTLMKQSQYKIYSIYQEKFDKFVSNNSIHSKGNKFFKEKINLVYSELLKQENYLFIIDNQIAMIKSEKEKINNKDLDSGSNFLNLNCSLENVIDTPTYKAIYKSFKHFGDLFIEENYNKNSSHFKLSNQTKYEYITMLFNLNKQDELKEIYDKIKYFKHLVTEPILLSYLKGYSMKNDCISSVGVLKEINERKIQLTSDSYSSLLKMYAMLNSEEKVLENYDKLLLENIKPNASSSIALIEIFLRKKKLNQAIAVLNDVKQEKKIIEFYDDVKTLKRLISYLFLYKRFDKVIETVKIVISQTNFSTNEFLYTILDRFFDEIVSQKNDLKNSEITFYTKEVFEIMYLYKIEIKAEYFMKIGQILYCPHFNSFSDEISVSKNMKEGLDQVNKFDHKNSKDKKTIKDKLNKQDKQQKDSTTRLQHEQIKNTKTKKENLNKFKKIAETTKSLNNTNDSPKTISTSTMPSYTDNQNYYHKSGKKVGLNMRTQISNYQNTQTNYFEQELKKKRPIETYFSKNFS